MAVPRRRLPTPAGRAASYLREHVALAAVAYSRHRRSVRAVAVRHVVSHRRQRAVSGYRRVKCQRALRIDLRTAHLTEMEDGLTISGVRNACHFVLLERVARMAPRLESFNIFVDDVNSEELLLALRTFPNLIHLVLRTTCLVCRLPLSLQPVLLAMHTVAFHVFRNGPCLDASLSHAAPPLSKRLVAASHLNADANVKYRALRQFDTVVGRNEPLNLPKSLNRHTLLWHDPFVPKMGMHTLLAALCTDISSLPGLQHLVLVHVLISVEHLKQLLSSLASKLDTLSVPVSMQGWVWSSKRQLKLFHF
ncbi:hypothetical protein FGB62_26g316 [Gracilaria domingensis]|nr:hypothetical protein FGB62_96g17 [Gracilaria domingensis]KAI0564349.1 hypothetical protein FGB62_26g316 [Gracilaria domingensis]